MMTSWEYKIMNTGKTFWSGKDKTDPEQFLSDLGQDGWNLVSVVPLSQMGRIGGGETTTNFQFFLPKSQCKPLTQFIG